MPTPSLALLLLAQSAPRFTSSLAVVFLVLILGGVLGWLIAAALGFSRARAFGPSIRWFALAAVSLVVFHLHIIAFAFYGTYETDIDKVLSFGVFVLLWIVLGAICAITGFLNLTRSSPRP